MPGRAALPDDIKICTIEGVRNHNSGGEPVELWRLKNGRVVVRAFNEGGFSGTDVDLFDLIGWLQAGPGKGMVLDHGEGAISPRNSVPRDRKGT
jgi:hypothetical protein